MGKRSLAFLFVVLLAVSSLSARSFGYSLAFDGEKTESNAFGGASLGLVWKPWEREWCNPSFSVSASLGTDMEKRFAVPSTTFAVNVDLFRTLNHPFAFVAHNKIAYDPSLTVGMQVRYDEVVRPALYLSASPFKFSQPDFWYEALSPFGTWSSKGWSWGVTLFRFTFLCL
jgi:hypothetical protein